MDDSWKPSRDTILAGTTVELSIADPDRDADELFDSLNHDDSWIHVRNRPRSASEMADLIRVLNADPAWVVWVVRLRQPVGGLAAGAVAGMTSYLDVAPDDARGEIGFTVYTPPVWATAVNPECKLLLMDYAFNTLGWQRLQLKTDIRNRRSQAAIEKLGAVREGVLRQHMRRPDGSLRDTVVYSVVADEWESVKTGLEARLR